MSLFQFQLQGAQQRPDGKQVQIPPAVALLNIGPLIQVSLSIESNAEKGLLAQGKPVPAPITGMALIDTGATRTAIDNDTAKKLALPVIDIGKVTSATHKDEPCNIYPVKFVIPAVGPFNIPRTMGLNLGGHLVALIGRDLLQHCLMIYNGQTGQITLCR